MPDREPVGDEPLPIWSDYHFHYPHDRPYLAHNGDLVSERKVLKSASGFYVGRTSVDQAVSWYSYSRESFEYYETEEDASGKQLFLSPLPQ